MIRFVARVHLLDNIGHVVHVYFTIALNCAEKNSELIIVEQIVVVSIVGVVKIVHTLAVALDCIPEKLFTLSKDIHRPIWKNYSLCPNT